MRDSYIDFLKFLGLTLIILAHVDAPYMLIQIRCFDVPLMLFASGLAFSGKRIDNYWSFIVPRTKRLVYPVYIFLTGYFSALYFIQGEHLDWARIACSYLLLNTKTIGYVWVIKVFLLIMILTPTLIRVSNTKSIQRWARFICILLCSIEVIALMLPIIHEYNKIAYYSIYETIPFAVAYSVPFLLGLRFRNISLKNECKGLITIIFLTVICFILLYHQTGTCWHLSPKYKYPPRIAFILYGSMTSMILWFLRKWLRKIADLSFVAFYGQHTIWIYLWHIPFIVFSEPYHLHWLVRFIIAYLLSGLLFYLQLLFTHKIEKYYSLPFLKYLKS